MADSNQEPAVSPLVSPTQAILADLHAAAALMDIPVVRPSFNLIPLTPANIAILGEHTRALEIERTKSYTTPDSSPTRKLSKRVQIKEKLKAVARKMQTRGDDYAASDYTEGEEAEAFLQAVIAPGAARIVEVGRRPALVNETLGDVSVKRPAIVTGERRPSTTAQPVDVHPPEIRRWLESKKYKPQHLPKIAEVATSPGTPPPPPAEPLRHGPFHAFPRGFNQFQRDRENAAAIPAPLFTNPRTPPQPPAHDPYAGMIDVSPTIPDTAREDVPKRSALQRWRDVKRHFDRKKGEANAEDRALLNQLPTNTAYEGLSTEQSRIMAMHLLNGVNREQANALAFGGRDVYP